MPSLDEDPRTPVTILAGWLGAGKTTLLNRILNDAKGVRYAVFVNEFGDIGVDDRLVVRADDDLVELSNGCVCCTVRGDLVRSLQRIRRRRPPLFRRRRFDRVLIETTGVAEPAPLMKTFLVEAEIATCYVAESVTTMVDAAHVEHALHEPAAVEQIALADLLVINKKDLVNERQRKELRQDLVGLNPTAPIFETTQAEIAIDEVLRRRQPRPHTEYDHAEAEAHERGHDISHVCLRSAEPLDEMKVRLWMDACVRILGDRLIRYKGFMRLAGHDRRAVLQGVYDLYTVETGELWSAGEPRFNELVFLGRNLDREFLEKGLAASVSA